MKNVKISNLFAITLIVFLLHMKESVADDNLYFMFVASNDGQGYHGNLTTSNDVSFFAIDELCNSSTSRPVDPSGFDRTYKAMIASDYRYPLSLKSVISQNWVLQPNTTYYNGKYYDDFDNPRLIGTTNINSTFTNPFYDELLPEDSRVWTGLNSDWSITDNNCQSWTSKSGDKNGRVGRSDAINSEFISYEGKHCDGHAFLYCVMQPTIAMLSPIPDAEATSARSPVIIEFNNRYGAKPNSVNTTSFTVTAEDSSIPVTGMVTPNGGESYTFTPAEDLKKGKYIVAVNGVKDKQNSLIPGAKFAFRGAESHIMFVTDDNWYGGDIEEVDGADDKCQQEAKELNFYGIYKAMIVADNVRGTDKDWVLKPDTEYYNLKSELISKTNSQGKFGDTISNYIYDRNSTTHKRVWTGMSSGADPWSVNHSNLTCHNWKEKSTSGRYGTSNSLTTKSVISYGNEYCSDHGSGSNDSPDSRGHLYCVKQ